jgi:hypothetical protein
MSFPLDRFSIFSGSDEVEKVSKAFLDFLSFQATRPAKKISALIVHFQQ